MTKNSALRLSIVDLIRKSGEGHIPSSFSIVDLIAEIYESHLRIDRNNPNWLDRDFFVLSKGHGAAALYVVLASLGLLEQSDLETYGRIDGILGGHPDATQIPYVESSTGSLGHGFPEAVGIALGARISGRLSVVIVLLGDGECQEGTIWEAANIAANQKLNNLCAVIDWNGSAAQLMPIDDLPQKWAAFGFEVLVIDGHDQREIESSLNYFRRRVDSRPLAIVARTIKGKGSATLQGHGQWHHKIPNDDEYQIIVSELLA